MKKETSSVATSRFPESIMPGLGVQVPRTQQDRKPCLEFPCGNVLAMWKAMPHGLFSSWWERTCVSLYTGDDEQRPRTVAKHGFGTDPANRGELRVPQLSVFPVFTGNLTTGPPFALHHTLNFTAPPELPLYLE